MAEFKDANGNTITANQAYKDAQVTKGFNGTFAEFMDKYGNQGYVKSALDTLQQAKDLIFGKPAPQTTINVNNPTPVAPTTILGMSKPVAIVVGVVAVGLIGYGVYRLMKK